MSGKLICDSVAFKKGGVYPPFKRLDTNFLHILGLFWASFVFLFTCLAFNGLHYLNNVVQQNGCFPLFIRVSALFAILPVIIPSFLLSLSFLSLLSLSLVFLGRVPGQTWADLGRPGQTWADPGSKERRTKNEERRTKNEERRDWINKAAF